MSIYSTVTAMPREVRQSDPSDINYEDPLVKLNGVTEKSATLAGTAVPHEDSLAEYFSDDEEREKALKALQAQTEAHKEKEIKLERET